jgi:hypothetical protein
MHALERALRDFVLGAAVPSDDAAAVDDWLARSGVSARDADALRSEVARLSVYRVLVRKRLSEAVELAVPRTRARLGGLFDEYFARFLVERGPRSHYLRDVTTEFLDFLEPCAADDSRLPPWTLELARHEALDVLVGSLAETGAAGATIELDPDAGLAFSATARVVRYRHAVHRLSVDPDDRSAPERADVALFVYRSPENEVRYLELTPLAAGILDGLLAGGTLRAALEHATRELGMALDDTVLEGAARVLADLSERGAIVGAKAVSEAALDLQNAREPAENGESPARATGKRTA